MVCTLIDNDHTSLLFSQTLFRFCTLSEFAKGFERTIWCVQIAHLYNAAHTLSSLSRCFQLSTNLDRDFFHYLWCCGNKQIKCCLACTGDITLIWDYALTDIQKLLPVYYYSENCARSWIWNVLPNMVFPPIWEGGSGCVLSMRLQVILDFLFARRGSAPIGGRKKGEFRDWTIASSANQASSGEIKESIALALGFRVIPTKPPLTFVERLKCSRALSVPGHFCSSFHSGILAGF